MLQALADGETDPTALAALADKKLRATPAQLCDALGACKELHPVYRRLLKLYLEELQFLEQETVQLEQEMAGLLRAHQEAVQRLAEVPGLGVDSAAQPIIAEVGAQAATFASPKNLSSWVGACPGDDESGGVSKSHRCPKGNRHMRRILDQCANAAVKTKGSIFEILVSPPRTAFGTQKDHLDHCQSALSADLDHLAPRGPLRGTRPSRVRKVEAGTRCENDSGTPKPWLLGASNSQSGLVPTFSTLMSVFP
jgi:transposase